MEYIIFIVASFFAAAAATLAGFGSSTLLVPIGMMVLDPILTLFLVACFHLFADFFKVSAFRSHINYKIFLLFGVPSIIGAFLGAMLTTKVSVDMIRRLAGGFIILYSVVSLLKPGLSIAVNKLTAAMGGAFSGLLAGLIGLGGAVRSMFLLAFGLPKEVYIATGAIIALVVDLTRIPTYIFGGVVTDWSNLWWLLPSLVITAFFGVAVGKKLLGKIKQPVFQKIVAAALLVIGLKLLF